MAFCDLLQKSICPKQTTTTWCERCESFQQTLQTRTLKSLPAILTVNCAIESKQVSFKSINLQLILNTVNINNINCILYATGEKRLLI